MMASSQSFSRIHWRMLLSPCPASPVNNAEPLWTVESNIRQWILENDWLEADRKSTRLNSSHLGISYAVFFLKKKSNAIVREGFIMSVDRFCVDVVPGVREYAIRLVGVNYDTCINGCRRNEYDRSLIITECN